MHNTKKSKQLIASCTKRDTWYTDQWSHFQVAPIKWGTWIFSGRVVCAYAGNPENAYLPHHYNEYNQTSYGTCNTRLCCKHNTIKWNFVLICRTMLTNVLFPEMFKVTLLFKVTPVYGTQGLGEKVGELYSSSADRTKTSLKPRCLWHRGWGNERVVSPQYFHLCLVQFPWKCRPWPRCVMVIRPCTRH